MKIKSALDYARDMLDSGIYKETHGPNRSPAIDALCNQFHYPLGSSWCILTILEGFRRAELDGAKGTRILRTASSQALLRWFQEQGLTSRNTQDLLKWKGAILIRTDPDKIHGHGAFAEQRMTNNGNIKSIVTIEGNTNRQGGRNGDGMYRRNRTVPLTPYVWTYCNTTSLAGGQWWA